MPVTRKEGMLTPREHFWHTFFLESPRGMSAKELVMRARDWCNVSTCEFTIRRQAKVAGYLLRRKKSKKKKEFDKYFSVDWSDTDTDIAQELGVTRQRVNQVRQELKIKDDLGLTGGDP